MLGEATGRVALRKIRTDLKKTREGRLIFRGPVVDSSTISGDELRQLNENTFRHAGGSWRDMGFDPDDRTPVALVDDEELAYVLLRYRQVHDFWHVCSGCRRRSRRTRAEVVRARAYRFTRGGVLRSIWAFAPVLETTEAAVRCTCPLGYPSRSGVHAVAASRLLREMFEEDIDEVRALGVTLAPPLGVVAQGGVGVRTVYLHEEWPQSCAATRVLIGVQH